MPTPIRILYPGHHPQDGEIALEYSSGARSLPARPRRRDEAMPADAILKRLRGGGGGGGVWHTDLDIDPLPPPGPVVFTVSWMRMGIPPTRFVCEGADFVAAASRARPLF